MNGWDKIKLGEIVEFAPKVSLKKEHTYAFIGMENINPSDRYVQANDSIVYDGTGGAKFTDNSILFARITPCLENRKIAQVRLGEYQAGIGSTEFLVFREKKDLSDLSFLYYLLKSDFVVENAINSMVGASGRQRADWQYMKGCNIPLPPLPIQRRIADILGRYDALIENYQRQISTLEGMAQELYREWFVRGRCPHAEPGEDGGLPVGWEELRLGNVIELKYGKSLTEENRRDGNVPVVGSSGVVDYHDEALVERPGIVVGRKGNVGSVFWIDKPFYPIDTAYYVESKTSNYFLFFNLQNQNFISGDAAVPGLNREQALSNKVILPDSVSLKNYDNVVKPIFDKKSNIQTQLITIRQTRDALLPRLLSGQLAVGDGEIVGSAIGQNVAEVANVEWTV